MEIDQLETVSWASYVGKIDVLREELMYTSIVGRTRGVDCVRNCNVLEDLSAKLTKHYDVLMGFSAKV